MSVWETGVKEAGKSAGSSIIEAVTERFSNPLVSSFVIAWSLWNYKFFVILFSSASIQRTFALITETQFKGWLWILNGLLIPASLALFYIYALPWPSRKVFKFWSESQKLLFDIKQTVDGEKLLDTKQSRQIRAEVVAVNAKFLQVQDELEAVKEDFRKTQVDYANQTKEFEATQRSLSSRTIEQIGAEKALEFVESILNNSVPPAEMEKLRRTIYALRSGQITHPGAFDLGMENESNPDGDAPDNLIVNPAPKVQGDVNDLQLLSGGILKKPDDLRAFERSGQAFQISKEEQDLLLAIASNGPTYRESVVDGAPDPVKAEYFLDELVRKVFLEKFEGEEGTFYTLAHEGRRYLVESGLSGQVPKRAIR